MGLSDGERIDGMMNAAISLHRLRGFKTSEHQYLDKLLGQIWPAMLASKGNGLYWIMGGDLDQDVFGETSPVKAAFTGVLNDFLTKNEKAESQDTILEKTNTPHLELCKYLDTYKPSMRSFLDLAECYGQKYPKYELTDVLKVYRACESFMYYANRYQDRLTRQTFKVRNLVAKIMGTCLERFHIDSQYLTAYMSAQIFDHILKYDVEDTVTIWFKMANMHHDVRFSHLPKSEIKEIFRKVRKEYISSEARLVIVLKFAGNKFHYVHKHKELFKIIQEHNQKFPQDLINADRIKKLCAKQTVEHAKAEKKNQENYRPYDFLFYEEVAKKTKKPKLDTKKLLKKKKS